MLYRQTKSRIGAAFQGLLVDFYPWDQEKPAVEDERARREIARVLYDEFRGPLTHNLGVWIKPVGRGEFVAGERGYIFKIIRLTDPAGDGLSEDMIETLESSDSWPFAKMKATVGLYKHKKVVNLERLYWGTRRLVERLSADSVRMSHAERFLTI